MSRFVLTAQLQLQAPNNVRQIVQQIQSQLNGVNINVQVQNSAQAQRQIQQVTQATNQATTAAERMGKAFALSVRRFAAFSIATRAVSLFTSTLGSAVQDAIDFERQLIKVAQVTGKSIGQLRGLTKQITNLSTGFGVASSDLLEVSTVLAQAGLSAEDTAVALKTLAKAALAPNFDSISETAEGAIAILAQFQEGVGSLEKQLGSINAVAGAFAVEASDLIDVIRRTGGVFKASGGSLNELLALFTSVRATTRESAESIGTGLRTIFTRIQRPKTIEFLKQFGVELVDLDGKFVGPYEAVKRLSEALSGLGEGDITFIRIAEELGGFRQIGKVLPLLQQFSTAQSALNVAMKAGDSLTQDAASAQAALAIRVMKVKEEFLALIRSVTETSTFQIMANTALSLASALIKIGDAIKPLLPMLAALSAIRLAKGMAGFFGGMMSGATSGRQYNKGGKVLGFASGGLVPGTGNRDTVPAMLSPGEFVIRKSSVNKMGAGTLAAMNENRYAFGGKARTFGIAALDGDILSKSDKLPISSIREKLGINLDKSNNKNVENTIRGVLGLKGSDLSVTAKSDTIALSDPGIKNAIYNNIKNQMYGLITSSAAALSNDTGISMRKRPINPNKVLAKVGTDSTIGSVFEGALGLLGAPFSAGKSTAAIDFPRGLGRFSAPFKTLDNMPVDAKKTSDSKKISEMLYKKIPNFFAAIVKKSPQYTTLQSQISQGRLDKLKGREFDLTEYRRITGNSKATTADLQGVANLSRKSGNRQLFTLRNLGGLIQRFATGGGVGTDTVPALLTPGEFVVNRSSAQRIGYGNLNRMNKVGKYAKGGVVQHFAAGGAATAASSSTAGIDSLDKSAKNASRSMGDVVNSNKMFAASMATSLIQGFLPAVDENSSATLKATHSFLGLITTITSVGFALEAFGIALSANQILQLFGSGAGGLGNILSNVFKGLKMGIAGQAGPMPLGGGIGSKIGSILGTKIQIPGLDKLSKTFERVGKSAMSGFSQGMKGMPGAQAYFAKNASPFMQNLSVGATTIGARAGQAIGSIKNGPIGRSVSSLKAGIGVGMNQGIGATQITRNTAGALGISGKIGQGIGSIPGLNSLTSGISSVGQSITKLGTNLKASLGPSLAVSIGFKAISGMIDSYLDYQGKLNKAISEGSVSEARKNSVESAGADAVNAFSTGLIGLSSLFGPPGVAIAGLTAGVIKLGSELPVVGPMIKSAAVNIMRGFGGNTLSSIESLAASQAGAVKTQKSLEQAQLSATQAMKDFEDGTITAVEALNRIRSSGQEATIQEQRAFKFAQQNLENRNTGGVLGYGRDVSSNLTLGFVDSVEKRNTELGKQSAEQINQAAKMRSQQFQMETGARVATIRSGFAAGKSKQDIKNQALGIGTDYDKIARMKKLSDEASRLGEAKDFVGAEAAHEAFRQLAAEVRQIDQEIANLEKEVSRSKAAFEAMNLGLRSASATSSALSADMDRFSSGLEVGGSTFISDVEYLQQALSSAAQAMDPADIQSAMKNVSANLAEFGVSEEYIKKFEGNILAFTQAQADYNKAFEIVKNTIKGKDFKGMDADDMKKKFAEELTKGLGKGVSEDAKKNLKDVIMDLELDKSDINKILMGDISVFGDKLTESQRKMLEPIEKISQERAKAEQVLIDFTKKRIESERNFVQAQQEALDLALEGREIQGKYGGPAVSYQEKRANILGKSNVEGQRLGLTNMRTGDMGELRARNAEIRGAFANIESTRTQRGGVGNKEGVVADEAQKDLQKAYKTQVDTIRGLIKLEEEQLKITQEKNKLEKESMESLVKGDIEEFFKKQSAVGATAAIATGDERLMRLYGAEALGTAALDIQRQQEAGVQTLYGQQLGGAGGLAEAAAGAALSARGVTDMRAAQVMAGTTAEEEASKSRLRELGGMLGETGQLGVDMAEMQVNTSVVNLTAAQVKFDETMARGNEAARKAQESESMPAVAKARGGLIYANRGIFVPRGTDTVPAMLTPGEFVVNRGAVQRGNNLQILQAMNGGANTSSSQNGVATMARGGRVQYFTDGGQPQAGGGGTFDNLSKFASALTNFNSELGSNIDKLSKTNISIKLDSTAVNVNLNDGGLIRAVTGQVKDEIFRLIENSFRVEDGRLKKSGNILST
jgi:TP901 family phage tail tape measure protein